VFVFFAFPVGLFTRRSGRAVGFGIGLFVTIVYWGLLFAGQTFGIRLSFSPFLAMWLPNFVILGAGTLFFALRARQ
jgi:lipopolysaccharide export system permease protein